jgi:GNAT superfamily N-acetyltransferase
MTDIVIRPYTPEAERFVVDSFVRSFDGAAEAVPRKDATLAQLYALEAGRPPLYAYAALMLARSTTLLACPAESPNVYLGWMSASGDTLEYVYVKHSARRLGIARELINAGGAITRQAMHTWPWTRNLVRNP